MSQAYLLTRVKKKGNNKTLKGLEMSLHALGGEKTAARQKKAMMWTWQHREKSLSLSGIQPCHPTYASYCHNLRSWFTRIIQ
jgi:hypothetical protein